MIRREWTKRQKEDVIIIVRSMLTRCDSVGDGDKCKLLAQ